MQNDPTPIHKQKTHTILTVHDRDYNVIPRIVAQNNQFLSRPSVHHSCIYFSVDWFEGLSVWQKKVDPGARAGQECQAWI